MKVRFYIDSDTGQPHVYNHNVEQIEVEQALRRSGEDRPGKQGARIAIGRTDSGRFLKIVYVPDPEPDSVFVITAYELTGKPLVAYRRRQRRRGNR